MTAMSFLGEPIAVRYKKIEKNEKKLNGCGIYDVARCGRRRGSPQRRATLRTAKRLH